MVKVVIDWSRKVTTISVARYLKGLAFAYRDDDEKRRYDDEKRIYDDEKRRYDDDDELMRITLMIE